jgi:peroxiredoxin
MTKLELTRRLACTFGLLVVAWGALAVAAAADDLGPPVGIMTPDIGTRLDQTGKPHQLADLIGKNGLVLFFFRSADWCPYCQAQLININGGVAEIEKRGYHVAGLSYDSPEILQAFTVKRHLTYTLLSDPKSEIIDLYGAGIRPELTSRAFRSYPTNTARTDHRRDIPELDPDGRWISEGRARA